MLAIKRENIIKTLGVPENKADDYLVSLIDELIAYCLNICTPKAAATIFDLPVFSKSLNNMTIEGVTFNLNKMVTSALQKSSSLAIFAGTCGEKTGQYSAQLIKDGHALEGLVVDLIGSEIAEGVAEYIHSRVQSEMTASGFKITNRYSP
ncbi:MAG TPA: hypothetical protein VHI78_00910, partial [Bacteroidales bacterium]|nr:hypothetical protein [Bacteroidales bacterium]